EITFGVLTKLDLKDKGTYALDVNEDWLMELLVGMLDNQLQAAPKECPFDKHLSEQNVRGIVSEAYAPEQGRGPLIKRSLQFFRGPAEPVPDANLSRVSTKGGGCHFPVYVDWYNKNSRTSPTSVELGSEKKNGTQGVSITPNDSILAGFRCGRSQCGSVRWHVREAERSLMDHFYTQIGKREGKQLSAMLDEDPALMERRVQLSKRLELYEQARDEIDSVDCM
uniref:Dynamin GTPase effector domain-containing protein n=2 Tax=Physcomitrium patens TaxID=3218 RepID=A0A7I4FAF9_PHYPA